MTTAATTTNWTYTCQECDETGTSGDGSTSWGWAHTAETGHTTQESK